MKIKELIEHLQTLDQDKELVIIGTDPTDYEYGMVVEPGDIELENVSPSPENGLEGKFDYEVDEEAGEEIGEIECYVIRLEC